MKSCLWLLLVFLACENADRSLAEGGGSAGINLSEMVYHGRLLASVEGEATIEPGRLVAASLDIPDWLSYFYADGTPRKLGPGREGPAYQVHWRIQAENEYANLLINNSVPGFFIATTPHGFTLGANKLPVGAFAFFVAQDGLASRNYVIYADLFAKQRADFQPLGSWQKTFRLAKAFKFPQEFTFKVRGAYLPANVVSRLQGVHPAPFGAATSISLLKNNDGKEIPNRAAATVSQSAAALAATPVTKAFYYDFVSLTRGYTISYYATVAAKDENAVLADPAAGIEARPALKTTRIQRRSDVSISAPYLPAAVDNYVVEFDPVIDAAGRVTLIVSDENQQTGELTVYMLYQN